MKIKLTINGRERLSDVPEGERLLDTLRNLGYTGVKRGCDEGTCGTCVVLLDGKPVNSCMLFSHGSQGAEITTIEGLGTPQNPHPIQRAFVDAGAVQCGFCTPGMVLSTKALLDVNPDPTEDEIKLALDGQLCRCTGYVKIIDAVKRAASLLSEESKVSGGAS